MNANDRLLHYNCSDNYYKHLQGLVYTDGVRALCTQFKCYWLLDLIASHQPQLREEFQVWKLTRNGYTATIKATDGNDNKLITQHIPYTDFEADECTIWIEGNVMLLPSEH